jgi:electron transport complex protein RnfD
MRKLAITVSPHIHDGSSTKRIMLDVIIALIPALLAATIFFGPEALLLAVVTIFAAVIFEWSSRKIMKRDTTSIFDLTAVITGLIMALGLPANTPLWITVISVGIAIVVVKQFFGGVGRNLLNPALIGHVLVTTFAAYTGYPIAFSWLETTSSGVCAVTSATPLQLLSDGAALPSLAGLFLGAHAGCMGETSILALLFLMEKEVRERCY